MSTTPEPRIKSGKASLIGGIVIGIACFVLWLLIARDAGAATPLVLLLGAAVSIAIGGWIRLADL